MPAFAELIDLAFSIAVKVGADADPDINPFITLNVAAVELYLITQSYCRGALALLPSSPSC